MSFPYASRHDLTGKVPGLVICGKTLNKLECYKSEFNYADDDHTIVYTVFISNFGDIFHKANLFKFSKGSTCNEYLSNETINAAVFVNMLGHILNPSRPFNKSFGVNPLVFDNSTQKIVIALWSDEKTNNTKLNITQDRWFTYGTFAEIEDPKYTKFQLVKMPSLSYLYVTRIESYNVIETDVITGGGTGQKPGAMVQYDEKFTSFDLAGFAISDHLWELFRIIPSNYQNNTQLNLQEYPVNLRYFRVEFTFLQLAANMGGFLSVLSALYLTLFGSRKINPWGIVQRYILNIVPSIPESYFPITKPYSLCSDVNTKNNDIDLNQIYSSSSSIETCSKSSLSSIEQILIENMDESRIQMIKCELRAELQKIIENELEKFRIILGLIITITKKI
ncbi:8728_t:CDS:2 [Gigaspora margarita]|uniref:8728_t:CDS:1 n=1 Tax=Gigaspora margarita TaxID=4874 RepID=A0ABN7UFT3_GIGMA|nr:8728_t:CDS:2 [Gigaspora margarita]